MNFPNATDDLDVYQPTEKTNTDLGRRLRSAGILIGATLSILYAGSAYTFILLVVLYVGMVYEWLSLTSLKPSTDFLKILATTSVLGILFLLCESHLLPSVFQEAVEEAFVFQPKNPTAFILPIIAISLSSLVGRWHSLKANRRAVWQILGLIYIGLGVVGMGLVLCHFSFKDTLGLLLMIWATDTGAYFLGRFFGGPKLAPKISPNKTWAGFLGGCACAIGTALLYGYFAFPYIEKATLWGVGGGISLLAQAGDLIESYAKRCLKVKDSSGLIPGHGGLLDRLDSLLFVGLGFLLWSIWE